jgi:hypothetical protein
MTQELKFLAGESHLLRMVQDVTSLTPVPALHYERIVQSSLVEGCLT